MESSESDRVSINMDHLTITLAGASIKLISNKTHTFYINLPCCLKSLLKIIIKQYFSHEPLDNAGRWVLYMHS